MKISQTRRSRTSALTVIEVLALGALLFLLTSLLLTALGGGYDRKGRAGEINCQNNQKQAALGLRLYAEDNGGRYPWQSSARIGLHTWLTVSNYIGTSKILACPWDKQTVQATNFNHFNESNVSYFLNYNASAALPDTILLGDREIVGGGSGILRVFTNASDTVKMGWSETIHDGKKRGNIAKADGSAFRTDERSLRNHIQINLLRTNRLTLFLPR
jgi:hypothetical protein